MLEAGGGPMLLKESPFETVPGDPFLTVNGLVHQLFEQLSSPTMAKNNVPKKVGTI